MRWKSPTRFHMSSAGIVEARVGCDFGHDHPPPWCSDVHDVGSGRHMPRRSGARLKARELAQVDPEADPLEEAGLHRELEDVLLDVRDVLQAVPFAVVAARTPVMRAAPASTAGSSTSASVMCGAQRSSDVVGRAVALGEPPALAARALGRRAEEAPLDEAQDRGVVVRPRDRRSRGAYGDSISVGTRNPACPKFSLSSRLARSSGSSGGARGRRSRPTRRR